MDPSNAVAAGPSNIPPPVIKTDKSDSRHAGTRKRFKRKRIASEAGEAGGSVVGDQAEGGTEETWSAPWLERMGVTSYNKTEQRLHDEVVTFLNYLAPTPEERHARAMVISQVSEVVKRRFPKASVDTFGSVAQDLYLPDGDTDLVIITPHQYDEESKKRALFQLAALLRNSRVTAHIQVIHRARVPVVCFQTLPDLGSLKIDISLNATDGIKAVPILRDYFDRMPALRYLVICIKSLLYRHQLNTASNSGLSSFGVILLAINYLQINPSTLTSEEFEDPLKTQSLGVLLMDFLHYYGSRFPYETGVVSVTQGKVLSKDEKGWDNPDRPHCLCIESILDPESDVGRPTSKIGQIRDTFQAAYTALRDYTFTEAPSAHNILGAVLGVSHSTLAHRTLLKDIVSSTRLEQALRVVRESSTTQGWDGPRRPQQPYSRNNSKSQTNDARNRMRDVAESTLPPKPFPSINLDLPSRPNPPKQYGNRYIAQGPSIAALRAANLKTLDSSDRSPPRQRRKA